MRGMTLSGKGLLLVLGLALIGALVWLRYDRSPDDTEVRSRVLLSEAASFPPGQTLIIGDSIVEGLPRDSLCGKRLFNGGINGTGAAEWKKLAPRLIGATRPSLVVISFGIVDARRRTDPQQWAADYLAIISAARGADVALLSVAPVEHNKLKGTPIADEAIARLNGKLRELAERTGARLVPPIEKLSTTDGVHLGPQGYAVWQRQLDLVCPR